MMVNIYVYQTIKGPRIKGGAYSYVLETKINGNVATLTKTGTIEPATENNAELTVLLKALSRMKKQSEILLVGANDYVVSNIENIPRWKENGWKNAKGKDIANIKEWKALDEYLQIHNIKAVGDCQHEYRYWMISEADKKLKEAAAHDG